MDIDKHKKWFAEYFGSMRAKMAEDATLMDLKYAHSLRVLQNAQAIAPGAVRAGREELAETCLLAALYHDIGRFEQVLRWGTYKDSQSADHGLLGVKVLKSQRPLAGESRERRAVVTAAVAMHNRLRLPRGLPPDLALVADVVRDADKLDIIRVMSDYMLKKYVDNAGIVLNVPDDPDLCNPTVLNDALAGRVASYADLRSVNDFKILLGTWMGAMNFGVSRHIMKKAGHLCAILQSLPQKEPFGPVRANLLARLERVDHA